MPGVWRTDRPRFHLCVLPEVWVGKMRMTTVVSEPTLFHIAPPDAQQGGGALPVLDERRRGTTFVELPCRSIINTPESTGMGFWSVNPYVGCEFGCSYCYARYAHRYVVERARDRGALRGRLSDLFQTMVRDPFEQRIFVKRRSSVLTALDTDLRKVRRRTARDGTQTILIGTGTDPYQPAERLYQITRMVLERLRGERGLKIGIITKSPLVFRDIELLKTVGRRNLVSVYVSLISMDVRVIKMFESRSPMPHTRLRALTKLVRGGVRAGLLVAPVLPGITDTTPQIEHVMRSASDAGAHFVHPVPLRLSPDTRARVLPIIQHSFPRLVTRYRTTYEKSQHVTSAYATALRARFREIGRRYGITDTGNEYEHAPPPAPEIQLKLL